MDLGIWLMDYKRKRIDYGIDLLMDREKYERFNRREHGRRWIQHQPKTNRQRTYRTGSLAISAGHPFTMQMPLESHAGCGTIPKTFLIFSWNNPSNSRWRDLGLTQQLNRHTGRCEPNSWAQESTLPQLRSRLSDRKRNFTPLSSCSMGNGILHRCPRVRWETEFYTVVPVFDGKWNFTPLSPWLLPKRTNRANICIQLETRC